MSIEPKDDFTAISERQQAILDLERARHLIAKGWCQETSLKRSFFLGRPQYCTTAAIAEACNKDLARAIPAISALFSSVFPGRTIGSLESNASSLQIWNDGSTRKKAVVLQGFDRAIEMLRRA